MHSDPITYLNGDYLALSQAKVSVLDRGFLFGDGVYEVVPVYGGRPLRLAHHLARLQDSLDGIRLANPRSDAEWTTIIEAVVERNGSGDQSIYVQVTRGVAPRDHRFPEVTTATVLVMASPLQAPSTEQLHAGMEAITLPDIRWLHCHIKAITLLPNVLYRQQAIDVGAGDAILVRDGHATEGSASNLFLVRHGVVLTPPKGSKLLPGITRDLIVELAEKHAMPLRECEISVEELQQADEVWLTSSLREVMPVVRLDGRPVGDGRPGPVWRAMNAHFQELKQALRLGHAF